MVPIHIQAPERQPEAPNAKKPHLTAEVTSRGFFHLPDTADTYGGNVSVYESSAAIGPHLWLTVEERVDKSDPNSRLQDATVHLSIEQAEQLIEQIQYLIRNHYQTQGS
jgi:hypothetical protein